MGTIRTKFKVILGDITKLNVDAIVNAANSELRSGSGVCGAIYAAAGMDLDRETSQLGRCATGKAKISGAHGIKQVKNIVHAVGPIYGELDRIANFIPKRKSGITQTAGYRGEDILLASTYRNSMIEAKNAGCKSIAFPCISTGVYGYPHDEAAFIAIKTCVEFCQTDDTIDEIVFCTFLEEDYDIYGTMCDTIDIPGVDLRKLIVFEHTLPGATPLDVFLNAADETTKQQ